MGIKTSGYDRMTNLSKRPILWEKGADSTPEAAATPTVTTVKAQQGDEHPGSAEGQSLDTFSDRKVTNSASDKQTDEAGSSATERDRYGNPLDGWLDPIVSNGYVDEATGKQMYETKKSKDFRRVHAWPAFRVQ